MKLVITEKPSVAASISKVIGATEKKDGFYEGNGYLVSWCVGHLVELAQPQDYSSIYEKWSYETLPIIPDEWKYSIKKDTRNQFNILKDLMHRNDINSVVCATDAGREGELIFRLVYSEARCNKPMERLWISSMEDKAIREGMESLKPGSDYDSLFRAALARQEADWLVGINGTRLFTVLYGGKVLKVGRVQTPTLSMIVERESEISSFKKQQYFMAHILMNGIDAVSERIDAKEAAEKLLGKCIGNTAVVTSVIKEEKRNAPPKLYDLTSLQRDANKVFGFTAKKTLDHTQTLYERKLVTYPRTDSQYLTEDMAETVGEVIAAVRKAFSFIPKESGEIQINQVLNSKKVSDHHAIIPTVEIVKADLRALSEDERKVLHLIAVRLFEATSVPHRYISQKVSFDCAGTEFKAPGKAVTDPGWKVYEEALRKIYKKEPDKEQSDTDEQCLPDLGEGEVFEKVGGKVTEHFTKPPARYTESSLLSAMEKAGTEDMETDVERKGLGTPATRADIIEKLVKDGFIKREKKNLIPTDNGIKLITVLPDKVKSAKLTADWENELSLVAKGETDYDDFISGITGMVKELVKTYHSVSDEDKTMFSRGDVLGRCPNCGGDVVKGIYGYYCRNKCGMQLGSVMGISISESQLRNLLAGKKIFVKNIKKKNGGKFDAYLIPEGITDYSYEKSDGTKVSGKQYKFKMEFPEKK